MSVQSTATLFRRAARNVALTGLLVAGASLAAGLVAGGSAMAGAAWGAGSSVLITAAAVVALLVPWQRWPLLAGTGVLVSLTAKLLVAGGVLLALSAQEGTYSPGWFFAAFSAGVVAVTLVEVLTLAGGRTLTVEL